MESGEVNCYNCKNRHHCKFFAIGEREIRDGYLTLEQAKKNSEKFAKRCKYFVPQKRRSKKK